MSDFGDNLKNIRIARKMTQDEFAEFLGTSKQVISRYENGQRSPKVSVVAEYAKRLGVSISDLTDLHSRGFFFFLHDDDDNSAEEVKPTSNDDNLPEDEAELLAIYRGLNVIGQSTLMNVARGLDANPDMKKDGVSSAAGA